MTVLRVGNSFFDNFDDILRAKTMYRSIVLTSLVQPHEAVTARKAPFRTRRGSGTRLMRACADFNTHKRYLCSKESFHRRCERRASLPPSIGERTPKKNRPKRQCANRQEVIQ